MSAGHAALAQPYLLWASVCMEQSVPLLLPKYLPWRSTLYAAVCECYYACAQPKHAEEFARRALAKVGELSTLEMLSASAGEPKSISAFRQATLKA